MKEQTNSAFRESSLWFGVLLFEPLAVAKSNTLDLNAPQ